MSLERIFWILVVYPAIFVALWLIRKSLTQGKIRPAAGMLLRCGFFLLPVVVLLARGASFQALGLTGGFLAPVAKWVLIALMIGYSLLMVALGGRKGSSGELRVTSIGVLAGAVSEEAFFRGILQTYLMAFAPIWQAIAVSALLQTLAYLANPPAAAIIRRGSLASGAHYLAGFLLECACGVLWYRTGTLLPAVLLNMFYYYGFMLRSMRLQRPTAITG
ncbi:MAG: CPBP family intramembrane metalloprotease [Firmicutes bacterium]|nr:CPBP family intramembrane metalloprotease [Bacillota bacterium]